MKILRVRTPFADYAIGDEIKDNGEIADILSGHNANHVVAVSVADEPRPAAQPTSSAPAAPTPAAS